jgi:hypothetical protein
MESATSHGQAENVLPEAANRDRLEEVEQLIGSQCDAEKPPR